MKTKLSLKEIERLTYFLDYLQDKVEDCYKQETKSAIREFLKSLNISAH